MADNEFGIGDLVDTGNDHVNQGVRVWYLPVYSELRHLLPVWRGRPRKQVTGLMATIDALRGTPKQPVDWTDPAKWISERLAGRDRDLAQAIWDRSNGVVNPRYLHGHWSLARSYGLLREDREELLQITEDGRNFLEIPGGRIEAVIDEAEGLSKLLSLVGSSGPIRTGGLVEDWTDYLKRCSTIRSESTVKDTMRRRMANLVARGLVERNGNLYSATPDGLRYLQQTEDRNTTATEDHNRVRKLLQQHEKTVRDDLRNLLQRMDPFAFERLIKRLLEEMGYRNVEVTSQSGDGGVDVVGEIEIGITSVREVVQTKRHHRTIQRKDLDALRGSLYRFDAVRGTIVTTSRFSKGTENAAFAKGVAPITLVDCEKLIDLLIEHGIGVRKRTIELLEMDPDALVEFERGT